MGKETMFALAVSLLTWGGVWLYLLRLDRMARSLERSLRDLQADDDALDASDAVRGEVGR